MQEARLGAGFLFSLLDLTRLPPFPSPFPSPSPRASLPSIPSSDSIPSSPHVLLLSLFMSSGKGFRCFLQKNRDCLHFRGREAASRKLRDVAFCKKDQVRIAQRVKDAHSLWRRLPLSVSRMSNKCAFFAKTRENLRRDDACRGLKGFCSQSGRGFTGFWKDWLSSDAFFET